MTTLSCTGHRPQDLGGFKIPNPIYEKSCEAIKESIKEVGATKAISGMATGVDQWFAAACIELGIPFVAAIPCEGQERVWPEHAQLLYRQLLQQACEVIQVSEGGYAPEKMHIRNHWMVDNSDVLLAV